MNWPDWKDETVVVVATGPSAGDIDLSKGKGKAKFLAVKDAARIPTMCPWADAIYVCDHHWWAQYKGLVDYRGIRICYDDRTVETWRGLDWLQVKIPKHLTRMLFDDVGVVGCMGNSGAHAINLAAQFGARKIVLVGFDMRVDRGKHFFGDHPYGGGPGTANCQRWGKLLDEAAPAFAERGIEVVNCSPVSALTAYPKMSFEEALS